MKVWLALILVLALTLNASASVKIEGGSSSSSGNDSIRDEREESEFVTADDFNIFSEEELKDSTDKLFLNGSIIFGDIPKGKALKMLCKDGVLDNNGDLKEKGWDQLSAEFWSSDNCFESEEDRKAYLQENKDFSEGVQNSLPIHTKQVGRFLDYVASTDGVGLSENAQLVIPRGIIYWTNEGTTYPIPIFGATSYKAKQSGQILYPSLEGEGFKDDIATAPYQMGQFDSIGWYSQQAVA